MTWNELKEKVDKVLREAGKEDAEIDFIDVGFIYDDVEICIDDEGLKVYS